MQITDKAICTKCVLYHRHQTVTKLQTSLNIWKSSILDLTKWAKVIKHVIVTAAQYVSNEKPLLAIIDSELGLSIPEKEFFVNLFHITDMRMITTQTAFEK